MTLKTTPFYGESGGQIGDIGLMNNNNVKIIITDTKKLPNGLIIHKFAVQEGNVAVGDELQASIDIERRHAIARNHYSYPFIALGFASNSRRTAASGRLFGY